MRLHYNQPTGNIILQNRLYKVHNNIIICIDKGEVTALTLAAFDAIDHATLTDQFSDRYGISGQAQIKFCFYL